jgi:SAM-dependent methyltransferase
MTGRIAAEHLARYAFAEKFIVDKAVLDVACGEGYGTAILAPKTSKTVGVDISTDVIRFANKKYSECKRASFKVGDIAHLPFSADSFDVVVCFETIEHLDEPQQAISELRRVLRQGGALLISTPNKSEYSDRFEYNNPFHKREMNLQEFKGYLASDFDYVYLYGQFSGASSSIVSVADNGRFAIPEQKSGVTHANVPRWTSNRSSGEVNPLYFVAVCSDKPIDELHQPIAFFDPSDWTIVEDEFRLRNYEFEVEGPSGSRARLQALESELTATKQLLRNYEFEVEGPSGSRARLQALESELTATKQLLTSRDAEIQTLRLAFNSLRGQIRRLTDEVDRLTDELTREVETAQRKMQAILNSTTWRATSAVRNIAGRSDLLRKTLRWLYLSVVSKR